MPTVQNQIDAINTRIGEVVKPNSITSVAALPTSAKVMIIDPAGVDGAINQVDASVLISQGQKVPFDDFGTIAEFLTDQKAFLYLTKTIVLSTYIKALRMG